jgi:hypothetical protein
MAEGAARRKGRSYSSTFAHGELWVGYFDSHKSDFSIAAAFPGTKCGNGCMYAFIIVVRPLVEGEVLAAWKNLHVGPILGMGKIFSSIKVFGLVVCIVTIVQLASGWNEACLWHCQESTSPPNHVRITSMVILVYRSVRNTGTCVVSLDFGLAQDIFECGRSAWRTAHACLFALSMAWAVSRPHGRVSRYGTVTHTYISY